MKIAEVMTERVVVATPETSYKDLVELLAASDVSGVPVVDGSGRVVGIVTEADLVSKEAYGGHRRLTALLADVLSLREHHWATKGAGWTARDIMTANPVVCAPEDDVRGVARRMLGRGVKRIPVVRAGALVGIVSRKDLLKPFVRSDTEIAADIAHMLETDPSRPDHCHVVFSVADGVVTLRGDVRYAWDKPIVAWLVGDVAGVIEVIDETYNREPNPEPARPWI